MIINPLFFRETGGMFRFGSQVCAEASDSLCTDTIRNLWKCHCFQASELQMTPAEGFSFRVGSVEPLNTEGYAYSVHVTEEGIAVSANSRRSLSWAMTTLMERIRPLCLENGSELLELPCMELYDRPALETRMLHLCFLPEYSFEMLRKFVRFAGALKYTHIIFEFWGMLRFDSLPELGWNFAVSKERIRELVREANDLGMEVIPMFNHVGHASQCRNCTGKHAVLDQNPRLQGYFNENGWVWSFWEPKTKQLLRNIRHELSELCGDGSYFHIGCDEVYGYGSDFEKGRAVLDFINEVSEELLSEGRTTILWGDMFLWSERDWDDANSYYRNCTLEPLSDYMLEHLDRRVLVADWQYAAKKVPVSSTLFFRDRGFNVVPCSWFDAPENINACVETAKQYGLSGCMLTTWHRLPNGMPDVLRNARLCWNHDSPDVDAYLESAVLYRKVYFPEGRYEDSGWERKQFTIVMP